MAIVLLIEDDPDVRNLATLSLQSAGLDVKHCETVHSARQLLSTSHFDLILLDMTLPDAHGLDLIDQLHESEPATVAKIALFTAANLNQEMKSYLPQLAGMIEKPFDHRELPKQVLDLIYHTS